MNKLQKELKKQYQKIESDIFWTELSIMMKNPQLSKDSPAIVHWQTAMDLSLMNQEILTEQEKKVERFFITFAYKKYNFHLSATDSKNLHINYKEKKIHLIIPFLENLKVEKDDDITVSFTFLMGSPKQKNIIFFDLTQTNDLTRSKTKAGKFPLQKTVNALPQHFPIGKLEEKLSEIKRIISYNYKVG